jgi:hypothetical protein
VTREEALVTDRFHFGQCVGRIDVEGGVEENILDVYRIGMNHVSDPAFRVPVQYGLRDLHVIHRDNVHLYHAADRCPLLRMSDEEYDRLEGVTGNDDSRLEVPTFEEEGRRRGTR